MATTVKRHCREHGGYFISPIRRGRPPVRCDDGFQCDAVQVPPQKPVSTRKARGPKPLTTEQAAARSQRDSAAIRGTAAVETTPPARVAKSASLIKAQQAKQQLEPLGWDVKGRAWAEPNGDGKTAACASVTASRGIELLTVVWMDGKLVTQDYALWDVEHPAANGKPVSNLPFDPDEIPDKELVQLLSGTRVRWFNRLGQKEESGYINPNTMEIVHTYNGHGDESPGMRVIRFTEAEGHGFRAFRLDALLKVG